MAARRPGENSKRVNFSKNCMRAAQALVFQLHHDVALNLIAAFLATRGSESRFLVTGN